MKRFLKAIAILIILAHVAAGLFYIGAIPSGLLRNLSLPERSLLTDFLPDRKSAAASDEQAGTDLQDAGEDEKNQKEQIAAGEGEAMEEDLDVVQIELAGTLPSLTEEDLYDLTNVLRTAGVLCASDGRGRDCSDQILCGLSADIEDPGHFNALFSIRTEDGQIKRGPSADLRVALDAPFLAVRERDVTIPVGTDYDPASNIVICMDLDGTVLNEYVVQDGYFSTLEAGDYEIVLYIYSRVNASSTFRNVKLHVIS